MKRKITVVGISVAGLIVIIAVLALVLSDTFWAIGHNNSVLHKSDSVIAYSDNLKVFDIDSPQGFVYDVSNETIIFTKGEDKVVHPGSTTKLLTALYALTILDPDEIITPKDELDLVKEGSSIAYILSTHKLSVEMLIEGMLVPSGNDAAFVLAAASGRRLAKDESLSGEEAVKVFIRGINDYANKLGLCGTYFVSPDGYSGSEHYSTTEDMAIIAKCAFENDLIMKYTSMQSDHVIYASGHTNDWTNTNKLLDPQNEYYNEYVIGLKTGSLDNEYALIFAFRFDDGREYIAGVFGSDNKNTRYEDALSIISSLEKEH